MEMDYKHTKWSRVLEKLIAAQLIKQFTAVFGTRKFIFKTLTLDPILLLLNPI
jgi:hypothetical protein